MMCRVPFKILYNGFAVSRDCFVCCVGSSIVGYLASLVPGHKCLEAPRHDSNPWLRLPRHKHLGEHKSVTGSRALHTPCESVSPLKEPRNLYI